MTNKFLPDGYEAPSTQSSFLTLEKGETNIRILSSALVGWEYWVEEGDNLKAIRSKEFPTETPGIRTSKFTGKEEKPKHFWAFAIWNYGDKAIQVLHVTQKTLQKDILNLVNDPDWGDPMAYDLKIIKTGEKLLTKYQVSPKPKKEVSEEIMKEFEKSDINLEDLYFGDKAVNEDYEAM